MQITNFINGSESSQKCDIYHYLSFFTWFFQGFKVFSKFYIDIISSKSTRGEHPVEDIPMCVYIHLFICGFMCVTPPGQTNNDRDLKFGKHTPLDLI